jgi:fatty-acyl-CoA synthase
MHALMAALTIGCRDDTVEMHTIPLFHANGWGRPQTATLFGATQVMVRRFDPAQVLRLIQDEKVTSCSLVPVMANALLNCPQLGEFDTSSPKHPQWRAPHA